MEIFFHKFKSHEVLQDVQWNILKFEPLVLWPEDCILEAVFTVSPNRQYLNIKHGEQIILHI